MAEKIKNSTGVVASELVYAAAFTRKELAIQLVKALEVIDRLNKALNNRNAQLERFHQM